MNENKAINMQISFINIAITQLSAHQCITIPIVLQCKRACLAFRKSLFCMVKVVVPHRKTATSITLKHYYKFPSRSFLQKECISLENMVTLFYNIILPKLL